MMGRDFLGFALEKAELLSSRLKEVLSSGQEYALARFGVDLGLKPELYPTWIILSTAAVGLLLLLGLSWAAVCGALVLRKKRGSPVTLGSSEPNKTNLGKTTRPQEQKKRDKKETLEKKTQSNGQPVTAAQVEVKETRQDKTEVQKVQAPVQVKKNKNKAKADVKPVQHVFTNDGKEPDDGAWETKVSNREKKQQRRKDKGTEDSGSPAGIGAPKADVEVPVTKAPAKKNKGSNVSSSWREEPSVNSAGWTDISMKISDQMSGGMEGTKWNAIHHRTPPKHQHWAQGTQAAWSIDGQIKTDANPVSFSVLGRNTSEPTSKSVELQWVSQADDGWSVYNGAAAVDPSSDWNAPVEHWGNYDEVVVMPAPPLKEQPLPNKVSEIEKDVEDPAGGAAKSKKKRRKKKKTSDVEGASDTQTVMVTAAPQRIPAEPSQKQNPSISSSQKKPGQIAEPPKPSKKRNVRKET